MHRYYDCTVTGRVPSGASEIVGVCHDQGRKKHVACWDWDKERVQLLRPIAAVLETDLVYLYRGEKPDEGLINLMLK